VSMLDERTLPTVFTIILRNNGRSLKVIIIWMKRVAYIVKSAVRLAL